MEDAMAESASDAATFSRRARVAQRRHRLPNLGRSGAPAASPAISALPDDALRELNDRITTRYRFNSVVDTGIPGLIARVP
jgi:hypothetical protein